MRRRSLAFILLIQYREPPAYLSSRIDRHMSTEAAVRFCLETALNAASDGYFAGTLALQLL